MVYLDQNSPNYSIEVNRAPGMLLKTEVEPRVYRQAAEWEQGEKKEVSRRPQICGPRGRERGGDLVTVMMLRLRIQAPTYPAATCSPLRPVYTSK